MANLVVRNLDQRIVDALKLRAAQHGRSAEAEHRALLETLLLRPRGKSFVEVLAAMPKVKKHIHFRYRCVPFPPAKKYRKWKAS